MKNPFIQLGSTIKNYVLPKIEPPPGASTAINPYTLPFTQRNAKLAQYYIMPLQLERIVHDISLFKEAQKQAENALYPTRYNQQRMFADLIQEGHTFSCLRKRNRLTLQKDFVIYGADGKTVNDECTKYFKNKQWFKNMIGWILDAQYYGYSLIQIGDMISPKKGQYRFPQMTNLRRWNIEPDRQNLVSIPIQKQGVNFLDPEVKDDNGLSYSDWTIYVDTPTDIGHSVCGYGLLNNIAVYAILAKQNITDNANYNEKFGTPYRHAKTQMTLEDDVKAELEKSLSMMGALGWSITPDGVTIDFHESNTGTGFETFSNFEERCYKMISKLTLGHPSAMDEPAGKLGGAQGGKNNDEDNSPAGKALLETEKEQDDFILNVLNDTVLPKFRNLGIPVPDDNTFGITNDKEVLETRKKQDAANLVTAQIWQTAKAGGLKLDAAKFTEITGIKAEDVPDPAPPSFGRSLNIQNRLKKTYGNGKI